MPLQEIRNTGRPRMPYAELQSRLIAYASSEPPNCNARGKNLPTRQPSTTQPKALNPDCCEDPESRTIAWDLMLAKGAF